MSGYVESSRARVEHAVKACRTHNCSTQLQLKFLLGPNKTVAIKLKRFDLFPLSNRQSRVGRIIAVEIFQLELFDA